MVYRCADGFIQPQGGGKDVFVHISAVARASIGRGALMGACDVVGRGALMGRGVLMGRGALIGRGPLKGARGDTNLGGLKKDT